MDLNIVMNTKVYRIAVLLISICMSVQLIGGTRTMSSFRMSVDGGFAAKPVLSVEDNHSGIVSNAGTLTSFSLGYRFQKGNFLFDTGLGVGYNYYNDGLENDTLIKNQTDSDGESFLGYNYYTNRKNIQHSLIMQFPLMFGAQWDMVYFLAGFKVSALVPTKQFEKGLFTLHGKYDRFQDIFHDMPTDGFVTDEEYISDGKEAAYFDFRLCAEFGVNLNQIGMSSSSKPSVNTCLSAFVEGGIDSQLTHSPIVAGVRLTLLFNVRSGFGGRCNCLD